MTLLKKKKKQKPLLAWHFTNANLSISLLFGARWTIHYNRVLWSNNQAMVKQKHWEGRENGYGLDFHLATIFRVECVDLCVTNLCRKLKHIGALLVMYFVKPLSTNEVVTSSTVQDGPQDFVCLLILGSCLSWEHHEAVLVLQLWCADFQCISEKIEKLNNIMANFCHFHLSDLFMKVLLSNPSSVFVNNKLGKDPLLIRLATSKSYKES